jgi:hypothetical protein
VILDVISPAKTGVVKNNEKANRSLFIFLFYRTRVIYSKMLVTDRTQKILDKIEDYGV